MTLLNTYLCQASSILRIRKLGLKRFQGQKDRKWENWDDQKAFPVTTKLERKTGKQGERNRGRKAGREEKKTKGKKLFIYGISNMSPTARNHIIFISLNNTIPCARVAPFKYEETKV